MSKSIILSLVGATVIVGAGAFYYTTMQQQTAKPVPQVKTVAPVEKKAEVVEEKKAELAVKPIVLKFSHVAAEDTPKGKAAIYFEKKLEALTEGKIDVQVYANSSLSADNQVVKALKFDNIQMAAPSFSVLSKDTPQLSIFDLPFLFKDMNHVHKVQDTEVGDKLKKMSSKNGIKALDFWDNHFKQFTSSKNNLKTPDLAEGQSFRIMASEVLDEQFKSVGAIPKTLPFKEVKTALEKKILDGQENTISNITSQEIYKYQDYLTISNHGYLGYLVIVSEKFYNSLTPELQEKLEVALQDATEKEREYAEELNTSDLSTIKDYARTSGKLKITELTEADKLKWIEKVRNIYPKFYDDTKIGKELIKEVMNIK